MELQKADILRIHETYVPCYREHSPVKCKMSIQGPLPKWAGAEAEPVSISLGIFRPCKVMKNDNQQRQQSFQSERRYHPPLYSSPH